jgi:hypothetical protein
MERIIYGWHTDGMCDRLTVMLLLATIARKTNRKALWHWVVNGGCCCRFDEIFETDAIDVSNETFGLSGVSIGCGGVKGNSVIDKAEKTPDAPVLEHGYYGHDYSGFDDVFHPSAQVERLVRSFMEKHWQENVVGVHVRRTDRLSCGPPSLNHYFATIDRLLDLMSGTIFIASDDLAVVTEFKQRYRGKVLHYPVRSHGRNSREGIVDAAVSLYLLRNTKGVIGSSISGFAVCAGWEAGLIDLKAAQNPNVSWSGTALEFKCPPFLPAHGSRRVHSNRALEGSSAAGTSSFERSSMSFFHVVPYSLNRQIATAYNEAVKLVPGNIEWILFTDADIMFLTPNYGHLIDDVLRRNPEPALYSAVTNRTHAKQFLGNEGYMQTSDMLRLRKLAIERCSEHGSQVTRTGPPVSGYFMLFSRKVWEAVGGFQGKDMLGVDWAFSDAVHNAGYPIYRIEGMFVAHFHRLDGSHGCGDLNLAH